MIDKETFTLEWVKQVNSAQEWKRKGDQLKNFEKAIMALKLLEELRLGKIDFIFKGGTSLLLILERLYRFSVDIDIIVENKINYIQKFDNICKDVFIRWDEHVREGEFSSNIRHFRFYYKPFVDDNVESYILLDVYEGSGLYSKTQQIAITSPILKQSGEEVCVTVPTIDCILADKLTAFAPHSIGIKLSAEPGKRPKRVEILKQMFDIANLFDRCDNLNEIKSTYVKIAEEEIKIANLNCSYMDTLKDSLNFALMIGFDGQREEQEFAVLSKGYAEFSKFIVDLSFDKWDAILCASKVAYLISCLLNNEDVVKYKENMDLDKITIKDKQFKKFEEYLYSSPESYYYFAMALNS